MRHTTRDEFHARVLPGKRTIGRLRRLRLIP